MFSALEEKSVFQILTVSTAPEHATRMLRRVSLRIGDKSILIIHAANCESVEEVAFRVRDLQPEMIAWTSSWDCDQVNRIQAVARHLRPNIELVSLPEEYPGDHSSQIVLDRICRHKFLRCVAY